MTRAERRALNDKAKARAARSLVVKSLLRTALAEDVPAIIGRAARTPKPCSCYACGNPRKHFKSLTRQEELARCQS